MTLSHIKYILRVGVPSVVILTLVVGSFWGLSTANAATFSNAPDTSPTPYGIGGGGGNISAAVLSGSTLYVAGSFTYVGHPTSAGVVLVKSSGASTTPTIPPVVGGNIYSVVSDGSGGWYVGGGFSAIGSTARNNLAHILSDGTVDPSFNPDVGDPVLALVFDGSTLYAGGQFNQVNGGVLRRKVAAFDTSGVVTSFDAGFEAGGDVYALVLDGSTLYAGGGFTSVDVGHGGTTRHYIAAFDTTTGLPTSFDPDLDSIVTSLVLDGSTLYAGGVFTTVNRGGTPLTRNALAAFDTATSIATSFDPDIGGANGIVRTLLLDGSTLYAGGSFTTVNQGGTPLTRNNLAAFNTATGIATSFDSNVGGAALSDPLYTSTDPVVYSMLLDGSTLYIGGNFSTVNGAATRSGVAALDTATGTATSFNPSLSAAVYALKDSGANIFAGGAFTLRDAVARNSLAAFDVTTGEPTSFDPNLDSSASSLVLDGSTLYVGGNFTTVNGGTTRNYLAAFDTTTGTATSFDPNLDALVSNLLLDGTTLYAGGSFTTVNGGTTRNYLAAFDTTTGTATSFDPNLDTSVAALLLDGTTLYAGGDFTLVNQGGTPLTRNHLAAFNTATGVATSFDPDVDSTVSTLALDGSTLYAGGDFTLVNQGGTPLARNLLAAFDTATGVATSFNPNVDNSVYDLLLDGTTLYVTGNFTTVNGGTTRTNVAALDTTTGTATDFAPSFSGGPGKVLILDASTLYALGEMTRTVSNSRPLGGVAMFTSSATPAPAVGGGSTSLCTGELRVTVAPGSSVSSLNLDSGVLQPGALYPVACGTHAVSAVPSTAGMSVAYSGDCTSGGSFSVERGQSRSCTVTVSAPTPTPTPAPAETPTPTPTPSGGSSDLPEGSVISASPDPDLYIINASGFKRLFLNPVIFSFYGHLGGWNVVKTVSAAIRDSFPTSGLFRNCEANDQKVYAVEVTGEDTGVLHHVNITGAEAVAQDPQFFSKVFCINSNEFNWYTISPVPYTALSQVPRYSR